MAIVLLGALASDVRGSVGGATFQRSAHGLTLKAKTSPVNTRTTSQASNRVAMFDLQTKWIGLTAAQRNAWSQWAQYQNLSTGRIVTARMSGQQAYMQANRYRLLSLLEIQDDPEFTPYSLPASGISIDAGLGSLTFVFPDQSSSSAYRPIVLSSFTLSPARNSRPPGTRHLVLNTPIDDQTWNAYAAYVALFGTNTIAGARLWIQYGFIQISNSTLSAFTSLVVTVT